MPKPINEYLIRFSGEAALAPKDLETGDELIFMVKAVVIKTGERKDNQDGTDDLRTTAKITELKLVPKELTN